MSKIANAVGATFVLTTMYKIQESPLPVTDPHDAEAHIMVIKPFL